jgi:hypothetical protein
MAEPSKKPAKRKKRTVTIKPNKKGQKPITFKSDGSLRALAGVDKNGKINVANVRKIAKGKGKGAQKARFYLDVLKK